jgi:hypothetical protein
MRNEDEVFRYTIEALHRLGVPHALVGSLAVAHYGEQRATLDADFVADLNRSDVSRLAAEFPATEFYLSDDAAEEAIATGGQFNIIHIATAFKIDMFVASSAATRNEIARARRTEILPGVHVRVAAAEDLILKKLEYYRMGESDKHLRDIAAMLRISGDEIDHQMITREAERLGVSAIWEAVRNRASRPG